MKSEKCKTNLVVELNQGKVNFTLTTGEPRMSYGCTVYGYASPEAAVVAMHNIEATSVTIPGIPWEFTLDNVNSFCMEGNEAVGLMFDEAVEQLVCLSEPRDYEDLALELERRLPCFWTEYQKWLQGLVQEKLQEELTTWLTDEIDDIVFGWTLEDEDFWGCDAVVTANRKDV